jgi:hypothetical protein
LDAAPDLLLHSSGQPQKTQECREIGWHDKAIVPGMNLNPGLSALIFMSVRTVMD